MYNSLGVTRESKNQSENVKFGADKIPNKKTDDAIECHGTMIFVRTLNGKCITIPVEAFSEMTVIDVLKVVYEKDVTSNKHITFEHFVSDPAYPYL